MKYGKTTCDANRPKDLEEYDFEVSERLNETLIPSVVVLDAALAMTHPLSRRRVCRLHRLGD